MNLITAFLNRSYFALSLLVLLLTSTSCQMGRTNYMTEKQRKQIETAYDSLEASYDTLIEEYNAASDTIPVDLHTLYRGMQRMHQEMDISHMQLMKYNMDGHMQDNRMMGGKMRAHMQGYMTGEWYSQMMSMHQQMAEMHRQMGQQSMAYNNKKLSDRYEEMLKMIPDIDEGGEVPFNEQGDPSLLNREMLYEQNCASCHGSRGQGIPGAFPPLVNSDWVTEDKAIPIRIVLNGLNGEIEVKEQTFQGTMPGFKARLSAAEIAAILNYLRAESNGNHPKITTQDVIRVSKEYSNRVSPWKVEELNMIE